MAWPSAPATTRAGGEADRRTSSITRAASSGSPALSSRWAASLDSLSNAPANREPGAGRCEGRAWDIGVRNSPGATTVTETPVPDSSAPST
jgi:hypothetical protein